MFSPIGNSIQCDTIREGWPELVRIVVKNGTKSASEPTTKFLLGTTVVVNYPLKDMIVKGGIGIPVWTSKVALDDYVEQLLSADTHGFDYTYGERLRCYQGSHDQLEHIINTIKKDKYSRRAVATLREPKDMEKEHTPCMIDVQCLFDGSRLNLFAHFRSHDAKAWPINVYGLAYLLAYISNKTLLYPGKVAVFSSNLHLYEEDWSWASAM